MEQDTEEKNQTSVKQCGSVSSGTIEVKGREE